MFNKLNKAFLFVVFALSLIKAQDVSIAVGIEHIDDLKADIDQALL